jgi:hypothetical protein
LTTAQGTFLIEALPPGIHNLVAYSLDGAYQVFQQGAQVAADATTPAEISLSRAPMVNVTFHVRVPEKTPPGVPLRFAGNLYQFGNTFADLEGGFSTVASRMPVLFQQPEGSYTLTLSLPAGADLRYKYTLGDGFWNAELSGSGRFLTRQLIVPEQDTVINDVVQTWSAKNGDYLTFDVIVPENTPDGEYVSIQFNPFTWSEPIPMWRLGENRWVYLLYGPLTPLRQLSYRYCRNDQCSAADALETAGYESPGLTVDLANPSARSQETLTGWNWLEPNPPETDLQLPTFTPRDERFIAGIEFLPAYHPTWNPLAGYALQDIQQLQANWLVLTPTWTYTHQNLPVLEQVPGQDALWLDLLNTITQTTRAGKQVMIYPQARYPIPSQEWWQTSQRDFAWWVTWFDRYRVFLLHHAELAERSQAGALVIGDETLAPALPGGVLPDGSPSGVPEDARQRWSDLLAEVRSRYTGQLYWAMPYSPGGIEPPEWIDQVDGIYLLWSAPLAENAEAELAEMSARAADLLDRDLQSLVSEMNKALILALAYPSARGGASGCVPDPQGACLEFSALAPQRPDIPSTTLDLGEQARAYYAMLVAVNERPWISGLVSRGYYPPVMLQDKSVSIHGKPAAILLQNAFSAWRSVKP